MGRNRVAFRRRTFQFGALTILVSLRTLIFAIQRQNWGGALYGPRREWAECLPLEINQWRKLTVGAMAQIGAKINGR